MAGKTGKIRQVVLLKTMACFGDSLVQGFPYDKDTSWVAQVERRTGIKMLNYGICGDCCDDIYDRLSNGYLPESVSYIVFLGGANDILQGRPQEHILNDFVKLIKWCRQQHLQLCIVLPLLTNEAALNVRLERLRETIRQRFTDTCIIDLQPAIGFTSAHRAQSYLDGVHPLAKTYTALGDYAAVLLQQWSTENSRI